jgi:hypothetical protein
VQNKGDGGDPTRFYTLADISVPAAVQHMFVGVPEVWSTCFSLRIIVSLLVDETY